MAGMRLDRAVAMLADVSRADGGRAGRRRPGAGRRAPVLPARSSLQRGLRAHRPRAARPGDSAVAAEPGVASRWSTPTTDDRGRRQAGRARGASRCRPRRGTLVGGLLARFPDLALLVAAGICPPDRPGIVHRLDKGTSGLLAVARTAEAYCALVEQLATRTMERRYLALVEGRWPTTGARSRRPSAARPAPRPRWR